MFFKHWFVQLIKNNFVFVSIDFASFFIQTKIAKLAKLAVEQTIKFLFPKLRAEQN